MLRASGLVVISTMAILSMIGCASSTVINSHPQGAQIFIDGEQRGTTPYTHSDRKTVGATTRILLKKEGYQDFEALIQRNERLDAGACAAGAFTLVPLLWMQQYDPERTFELVALDADDDTLDEGDSPEPPSQQSEPPKKPTKTAPPTAKKPAPTKSKKK